MKLVTVRCRPIFGTDFVCKSLYRFKFVNFFGDVGPTAHIIIQAGVYNFVSTKENFL